MLATDNYDMKPASNKISVTTLIKPTRQVILSQRVKGTDAEQLEDISNLVNAGIGSAIHGGLEAAWQAPQQALRDLGYPERVVESVVVNPSERQEDMINVFTELRTEKPFKSYVVSGCADLILDDEVHDYKTTGCYSWLNQNNYDKYRLQLSIYRWLNQDKVLGETGYIHYYLKDWSKLEASYKSNYPSTNTPSQDIPLLSIAETEQYIRTRLSELDRYWDMPESDLPRCTQEELWQGKPKFQYFGTKGAKRASKNFDSEGDANAWMRSKGKGEVRYKPAKAKACAYCSAMGICSQAQSLRAQGLLDI